MNVEHATLELTVECRIGILRHCHVKLSRRVMCTVRYDILHGHVKSYNYFFQTAIQLDINIKY
jgi:hypothetical protein